MKQHRLYILLSMLLFSVLVLTACSNSSLQNPLSTSFRESAAVVRAWTEACLDGNFAKAGKLVSDFKYFPDVAPTLVPTPTPDAQGQQGYYNQAFNENAAYDVCAYLARRPDASSLKVIGVEDTGFLLNSGELWVIFQNPVTQDTAGILMHLNNSERGSVISWIENLDDLQNIQ